MTSVPMQARPRPTPDDQHIYADIFRSTPTVSASQSLAFFLTEGQAYDLQCAAADGDHG
jgi:hypothetical protein